MSVKLCELPPALAAALVRAQGRVVGVAKNSRNAQQGYNYTSAEDLITACGQAMTLEGLGHMRLDSQTGAWERLEVESKNGTAAYLTANVRSTYMVFHESGPAVVVTYDLPAVQTAGRPADKAVLATHTESLGYMLRDVLLVSRGHDNLDLGPDPEKVPADVNGRDDAEPHPLVARAQRLAAALPGRWEALDAYSMAKDGADFDSYMGGLKEGAQQGVLQALEDRAAKVGDGPWSAAFRAAVGTSHIRAARSALGRMGLEEAAKVEDLPPATLVGLTLYVMGL